MLAASGCHKDSFSFDEFTRPTTATPDTNPDNDDDTGTPDDGDEIPVPMNLPVVSIATGDMPVEDGAGVTLTITSSETVPATLTGGLSVTINIVGADAADFNNAVCTNIVCIVTIPAGGNSVSLILSPLSDFSTETERWTATLEDGSNYNLDAGNNNVGFDITDLIAAVDIATGDMPIEDGAGVTLTITSSEIVPAALTDGLSVTINIVGADAADFNNAVCTNIVCIVTIPAGSNSVSLILSPLSDFSTETERWTATLEDGDDYNLDAGNNNVGFDITDLIAAVGIATGDMPIEDGAGVTLTITSSETVPATLTGGLSVTINIVGADAADFNNAVCTNIVCIVTIPAGGNSVSLILSPLSDFSTETERWTATLEDGDDYNLDAGNNNADFAITDLIAALGIVTSDTARIEGGAVTLTITSSETVPATLTGGLSVTINIGGADNADFTSAACTTPPQCVVVILSGQMNVTLTITASPDADPIAERWTAAIAIPANGDFAADPNNANADFIISETDILPTAMNGRTLAELNAYTVPTPLAADAIRNRQSDAIDGVAITASLYADASGNPQIYVQLLEFAALGIWVSGNAPMPNVDFDHDFRYAFLGDNAVSTLPTSGTAGYDIEGDATYKGVNFFPDGFLNMDFAANTFDAQIQARDTQALNHFGSATAMLPTTGGMRGLAANDDLVLNLVGTIDANGLMSTTTPLINVATGFFADLASGATGTMEGRFYDAAGYDPALGDPSEIAGAGIITDSDGTGDLHFGFVGRCTAACAAGD